MVMIKGIVQEYGLKIIWIFWKFLETVMIKNKKTVPKFPKFSEIQMPIHRRKMDISGTIVPHCSPTFPFWWIQI